MRAAALVALAVVLAGCASGAPPSVEPAAPPSESEPQGPPGPQAPAPAPPAPPPEAPAEPEPTDPEDDAEAPETGPPPPAPKPLTVRKHEKFLQLAAVRPPDCALGLACEPTVATANLSFPVNESAQRVEVFAWWNASSGGSRVPLRIVLSDAEREVAERERGYSPLHIVETPFFFPGTWVVTVEATGAKEVTLVDSVHVVAYVEEPA